MLSSVEFKTPKLVALCGSPGSGKTTVAQLLALRYDGVMVDDAQILRQSCMTIYGLTYEQVSTQEGKSGFININNEPVQIRKLLGDMGKYLEAAHGSEIIAELAIAKCNLNNDVPFYVFGSCRKNQGRSYQRNGGIVVHVDGTSPTSIYDFDVWNNDLVQIVIPNKGTLLELRDAVYSIFDDIYTIKD